MLLPLLTFIFGIVFASVVLLYVYKRKDAKRDMRLLEALAIAEHFPGSTVELICKADHGGKIVFVESHIQTIERLGSVSLIGLSITELNNRADDASSEILWHELREKKVPYNIPIAGAYVTGATFSFMATIIPILHLDGGIRGFVIVHAEDKETTRSINPEIENKLDKAHAETILTSIADGVIVTDKHGDIIMINNAGEQILGISNCVGKSVLEVLPLEEANETLLLPDSHPVHQALHEPKALATKNYVYVRADFTKLWLAITTAPIVVNGAVEGVVAVLRDATLEKQIDRSKTEFVSLASHQLRTPLTAINWYTELLLDHGVEHLTDDQKSFVAQIRESSSRMNDLVSSLLNVSRLELGTFSVEPKPLDIVALVKSVLAELQPKIVEKEQYILLKLDEHLEKVPVDENLMRIIVQNLLSNAVKYTREKGQITIKLYRHYPEVRFEVSDNGYGIPQNQRDKIFTKLFRADNVVEESIEGNGLGLYIVRSILEQTGGDVWFDSEQNIGTTFYVSLPLTGMRKKEGTKTLI